MKISQLCMVELWFECIEYYPYIWMCQYMLIYGVGAKPVTNLMQYHLLQWDGATTKIHVKRYERYKIVSHIPVER